MATAMCTPSDRRLQGVAWLRRQSQVNTPSQEVLTVCGSAQVLVVWAILGQLARATSSFARVHP